MPISVGDFAEQLLAKERRGEMGTPQPPAPTPDMNNYGGGTVPDVSQVEVPADFVNTLLEEKTPTVPTNSPQPTPISEDNTELTVLIQEVRDLLIEVKQTLTEMTTVGMGIGAPAPSTKKKDKDEDDLTNLLRKVRKKRASK